MSVLTQGWYWPVEREPKVSPNARSEITSKVRNCCCQGGSADGMGVCAYIPPADDVERLLAVVTRCR